MSSCLCTSGAFLVMLFKRNYSEQKYKEMRLSQPLIPLLRANLFLAIQTFWSLFVFCTAYNC